MSLRAAEAEIGKILLEISGILIMVIEAVNIIKTIFGLAGSSFVILRSLSPTMELLLSWLGCITYNDLLAVMLVIWIAIAVVGYKIYRMKLLPSMPGDERDMWIGILSVLLAITLLVGEFYTSIALIISLAGLC